MSNSVLWVTQWLMPQLGTKKIKKYLQQFNYGNEDFSGGMKKAWVSSSLKISAMEQLAFITKLWKGDLSVSKEAIQKTKNVILIEKYSADNELYGKTGTGCLDAGCMQKAGRMIGTFVGVVKKGDHEYAFASNASDLVADKRPAGPRLRETTITIFKKMGLINQ